MCSLEIPKFEAFARKENKENKESLPNFKIKLLKIELKGKGYDHNCMQVSMAMILKDLDKSYIPDLKELNKVSHKKKGKGTWPGWILSWLKKNYEPEIYSKFNWKKFVEKGEDYLNSQEFKNKHEMEKPGEFKKYLEHLGIEQGIASSQEMIKSEIPINLIKENTEPKTVLKDILERIKIGERAIFLLDGDHWIPVTGFDGENVYYNNPLERGTEIDRKKELNRFIEKWSKYNVNTVIMIKH